MFLQSQCWQKKPCQRSSNHSTHFRYTFLEMFLHMCPSPTRNIKTRKQTMAIKKRKRWKGTRCMLSTVFCETLSTLHYQPLKTATHNHHHIGATTINSRRGLKRYMVELWNSKWTSLFCTQQSEPYADDQHPACYIPVNILKGGSLPSPGSWYYEEIKITDVWILITQRNIAITYGNNAQK